MAAQNLSLGRLELGFQVVVVAVDAKVEGSGGAMGRGPRRTPKK